MLLTLIIRLSLPASKPTRQSYPTITSHDGDRVLTMRTATQAEKASIKELADASTYYWRSMIAVAKAPVPAVEPSLEAREIAAREICH